MAPAACRLRYSRPCHILSQKCNDLRYLNGFCHSTLNIRLLSAYTISAEVPRLLILNKYSKQTFFHRRVQRRIALIYKSHTYSLCALHALNNTTPPSRSNLTPTPTPRQRHIVTKRSANQRGKKPWALETSRRYVAKPRCLCAPLWALQTLYREARQASKQSATPEALNWPTPSSSRLPQTSYTY